VIFSGHVGDVRFNPHSGRKQLGSLCQLSAISRHHSDGEIGLFGRVPTPIVPIETRP
jgi:hypothetical protein